MKWYTRKPEKIKAIQISPKTFDELKSLENEWLSVEKNEDSVAVILKTPEYTDTGFNGDWLATDDEKTYFIIGMNDFDEVYIVVKTPLATK